MDLLQGRGQGADSVVDEPGTAGAVARVSNSGEKPSKQSFRQMYAKRATASSSSSNNLDANTEETKENFTGSLKRENSVA